MKRLGVNIDHIATLRNARGESHPDPSHIAKFLKKKGVHSITIHLREDRRHIRDHDVKKICSIKNLKVNLELFHLLLIKKENKEAPFLQSILHILIQIILYQIKFLVL